MKLNNQLRWVFAVQAVLLVVAACRNFHQLNPDAIAYMRIAGYYANGQTELALTGYWGPLLSWLMVPALKLGADPMVAARVAMALSGVIFLAGAVAVFRVFRLPRMALLSGALLAGAWSVFWSVRNVTPDLLMAGLVALAVSATVELFLCRGRKCEEAERAADENVTFLPAARRTGIRLAIAAGVWWGAAYLAKALVVPLAGLTTAGLAVFALSGRGGLRWELARRLGLVWLCSSLVAAPWIGMLSLHYGKFTFSTTGPIAHALAGPGEQARYHPAMVTLHQPDTGRVTQWEEPSRMAYQDWSPFANRENFQHQLVVMGNNLGICWDWLCPWRTWLSGADMPAWRRWFGTFDLLGIGGLAVLCAGVCVVKNRTRLRRERWCWAVVPVSAVGALYLPFFVMAEDSRYFYPVLPFLWVLVVGTWGWVAREWLAFRVVNLAFAAMAAAWFFVALAGVPNQASRAAHEIAARVRGGGFGGSVAGSALLPGGRAGLYVAFLLDEQWLGDELEAGPEAFLASGANLVAVRRDSRQAKQLARNPNWKLTDPGGSESVQIFVRVLP